jgi:hypothetical protein
VEISEAQFERLIGMLADHRVALHAAKNEISAEIQKVKTELSKQLSFLQSHVDVVEVDLNRVQKTQRAHDQALDGLTQLGKSNFDMNESILKHLHGESSSIRHGHAEESRGSGPQ